MIGASFALAVRFELRAGCAAAFDALVAATLPAIRAEPGTLAYVCATVAGAPDARVFLEVYRDRAAFEAHERGPATRRFLELREPMLASVRVEILAPYDGLLPGAPG